MISKLLKEPFVHFLIGALALFVFFALIGATESDSEQTIIIDQSQIKQLEERWQETWRRQPSEQERQGLIDDLVRNEVYYREGLRLGLDQDDAVVRNRMIQKIRFLQDEVLSDPTPEQLEIWLNQNKEKYRLSNRLSFDQQYIGSDFDRESLRTHIEKLNAGGTPEALSSPLQNLPAQLNRKTIEGINQQFGENFGEQVDQLDIGQWQGPIKSGFGYHLIKLNKREVASEPKLSNSIVAQRVENDWRAAERKKTHEAQFSELKKQYDVIVKDR